MITRKKGWLLRDFVIVGIIAGAIIALYVLAVGSVADNYNNQQIVSPNFASHYNQFENNLGNLDSSASAVKGGSGLNLIGTFNVAFNSVFTVFSLIWSGLGLYGNMFANIYGDFPFLPKSPVAILLTLIVGILTVGIIFVWLSSVTRGKI